MLTTTSTSYILLASLDAARRHLATRGRELFTRTFALAERARRAINAIPGLKCLGPEVIGDRQLVVRLRPDQAVHHGDGAGSHRVSRSSCCSARSTASKSSSPTCTTSSASSPPAIPRSRGSAGRGVARRSQRSAFQKRPTTRGGRADAGDAPAGHVAAGSVLPRARRRCLSLRAKAGSWPSLSWSTRPGIPLLLPGRADHGGHPRVHPGAPGGRSSRTGPRRSHI